MPQIPAITIHQPWAALVACGVKLIETRTHARFAGLVGQRVAIHASRTYDDTALKQVQKNGFFSNDFLDKWDEWHAMKNIKGVILGTAHAMNHRELTDLDSSRALLPAAELFGLALSDARIFSTPIEVRGQQGIWTAEIPDDIWKEHLK